MCGAPAQTLATDGLDTANAAIVQGTVEHDGLALGGAYVRLLDGDGEFTAEVVTSATGSFRFFARPGAWTLRVLAPGGVTADVPAEAATGRVTEVPIRL